MRLWDICTICNLSLGLLRPRKAVRPTSSFLVICSDGRTRRFLYAHATNITGSSEDETTKAFVSWISPLECCLLHLQSAAGSFMEFSDLCCNPEPDQSSHCSGCSHCTLHSALCTTCLHLLPPALPSGLTAVRLPQSALRCAAICAVGSPLAAVHVHGSSPSSNHRL